MPILVLAVPSISFFYHLNIPGVDLIFLEYSFGPSPQVIGSWMSILSRSSILLVLIGLGLSYWNFGRSNTNQVNSFNHSRLSTFVQNGFYLDRFYLEVLAPSFDWLAFKTSKIDTVLINPLLNTISIIVVIFSKLTDLFDKLIVDGLVSIVRKVMQIFGLIFTKFHSERVQLHFCLCDHWIGNNTGLVKIYNLE